MYIEALNNGGFKEEFSYLEPKKKIKPNNNNNNNNNDNNNNLYKDKETTDNCILKLIVIKIEKEKLYGSTPTFL